MRSIQIQKFELQKEVCFSNPNKQNMMKINVLYTSKCFANSLETEQNNQKQQLKQVADILVHTTSQITEMYYVKKDTTRLNGLTDAFSI